MTRNQSHDVKDFRIQMLLGDAKDNLDADANQLVETWTNNMKQTCTEQLDKFVDHEYAEEYEDAIAGVNV